MLPGPVRKRCLPSCSVGFGCETNWPCFRRFHHLPFLTLDEESQACAAILQVWSLTLYTRQSFLQAVRSSLLRLVPFGKRPRFTSHGAVIQENS